MKRRPSRARPSEAGGGPSWAPALLLVGLAAAHRLLFLWGFEDRTWPFSIFYFGDTRVFFEQALDLIRGTVHEDGIPFRPPLFPRILAGIYWFVGVNAGTAEVPHTAVRSILALVSALAPALLFALARPALGDKRAFAFALPWVWYFGALVLSAAAVNEGLYITMLLAVLVLWTRWVPSPVASGAPVPDGVSRGVVVGLGVGLLHLLRAEAIVFGVAVVVVTAWPRTPGWRRQLAWAGSIALGWSVSLVPSTVAHWQSLGRINQELELAEPLPRFVPVSLYGPLNLGLANHADADGRFSPTLLERVGSAGTIDLGDPRQLDLVLRGDRHAWDWVRHEPRAAFELVVAKWSWALQVGRLGWGSRDWPGGLEGSRQPVDVFVPDSKAGIAILVPLVLVGMAVLWREGSLSRHLLLVIAVAALAPAAAITLFFGYVRQALLWMPFMTGLAGIGVLELAGWIGRRLGRAPRAGLRPLVLVAGLMLAVEIALFVVGAPRMQASGAADERGRILQDDVVRLTPL